MSDTEPQPTEAPQNLEQLRVLQTIIEEITEERNQLERELNDTRALLRATQTGFEIQSQANVPPDDNPQVISDLVMALRIPLTTIVGYLDLLLDEAVGDLNPLQRKFLQRTAANVITLIHILEKFATNHSTKK